MIRRDAKEYLINMSYKLGTMAIEYLTEKDGEKMREAIRALERESVLDKIKAEIEQKAYPIVSGENKIERGMTLPEILQVIDGIEDE